MKKTLFMTLGVSVLVLVNSLTFSYAKSELVEGKALAMAHQYIENSLGDEAWKGNNPIVSAQSRFYTDDEKKVSYIEYKISCDSTPDCGFIMMNVDGNDVSVPIASPSGNTPSEILDQGEEVSEKLYYFGPFDLYSKNEITGEVQALDPQVAVDLRDDTEVKRSTEEKKILSEQKEALKLKLQDAKIAAKEFKKSDEFKKQKEEIQDQILNVPKEELSMKVLDFSFADNPDTSFFYTSPGVSNVFIAGSSTVDCPSRIPCYNQFQQTYNGYNNCYSGCSPTAVAMLFGYYDRNGFPNLVTGSLAPSAGVGSVVQTLVNSLRTYIGTTCTSNGGNGSSTASNVQNAKGYAISKGYINTSSSYNSSPNIATLWNYVKIDINASRPIIAHMKNPSTNGEGHATVIYGYKTPLSSPEIPIVRMNMGWGNNTFNSLGVVYNYSTLDQNMSAISYGGGNNKIVYAVTRFIISN